MKTINYRITINFTHNYNADNEIFTTDFSSLKSALNFCKNHKLKIDEETQANYISYDGCIWVDEKFLWGYGVEYTNAYTTLEKIIIL